MTEILPGVYEHKTTDMTWLCVNTDHFLPTADWMEKYLSGFRSVIAHPPKVFSLMLELR